MKKPLALLPLLVALVYAAADHFQTPAAPTAANPEPSGPQVATQFADCPQLFYRNTPPAIAASLQHARVRELCFDDFAVLHDGNSHTPLFAAEKLSARSLADADEKRTDRFYEEARLRSSERATLADYRGSGYDRGHMAAAAQRTTPAAMAQSFSLANMVPQVPENNRGVWARAVEAATRKYVQRARGEVYVFTGPYFDPQQTPRYAGKVRVPDALYKLVYDPTAGKSWVYWAANADVAKPQMLAYDELVRRTGIRFLPQ